VSSQPVTRPTETARPRLVPGVGADPRAATSAGRRPRLAYVVSRFPSYSETFVLREISQLEAMGFEVVLCPLLRESAEQAHPAARPWLDRAVYTPFVSRELLRDAAALVRRRPANLLELLAPFPHVVTTPNFLVGTAGILLKVAHLARVLEERQVDHVHAHFATHPAMAAYLLHRLTGIPFSVTVHAHDLYVHTAMLDRKLRAADFVVTISDYNRERLAPFVGTTPVHVVRSSVDLTRYPVQSRVPDGPFTVLAVGSLRPYKGHQHLIDAMHLLPRSEDLRLRIVGGGPGRERLLERIERYGLRDRVELLGPRSEDEIVALLQEAHVFALPSVTEPNGKMEGLPVVLIESLASGVPTVATSLSGIPELVRPGETGQLVPEADAAALAAAIRWVRDHPDEARAQALAGRALVEREYDLARNVGALATIFQARHEARADVREATR
jgi:colanic acid/amylovoran biosynthesis glycosyltransferase